MTENKTQTLYDLEKSLLEELESRKEEITALEDSYEIITEIVDGYLPVYTANALEIAMSDLWLALDKPDMAGGNAFELIVNNIDAHLHEKAQAWIESLLTGNN